MACWMAFMTASLRGAGAVLMPMPRHAVVAGRAAGAGAPRCYASRSPTRDIDSSGGFPTMDVVGVSPTGDLGFRWGFPPLVDGVFPHWEMFFPCPRRAALAMASAASTLVIRRHSCVPSPRNPLLGRNVRRKVFGVRHFALPARPCCVISIKPRARLRGLQVQWRAGQCRNSRKHHR